MHINKRRENGTQTSFIIKLYLKPWLRYLTIHLGLSFRLEHAVLERLTELFSQCALGTQISVILLVVVIQLQQLVISELI